MTFELPERYVKAMVHCIGLDQKNPYKRHGKLFYKPYRNYFATGPNCDNVDIWLDLEKRGYAYHGFGNYRWTYSLNDWGIDALRMHLGITIYRELDYMDRRKLNLPMGVVTGGYDERALKNRRGVQKEE